VKKGAWTNLSARSDSPNPIWKVELETWHPFLIKTLALTIPEKIRRAFFPRKGCRPKFPIIVDEYFSQPIRLFQVSLPESYGMPIGEDPKQG
jgi:hypothetical protein